MEKSIKAQLNIKENAEELQTYLTELHTWEKKMKLMEDKLVGSIAETKSIPPPRNAAKKGTNDSSVAKLEKKKRISGSDYGGWDKFNADEACRQVEEQPVETVTGQSESQKSPPSAPDMEALAQEKLKKIDEAFFEKEQGNQFVKAEKWEEAKQCYSRAIDLNPDNAIYHANRALCHLKLANFKAAEVDSTVAIQLDPTYVKAYQRRAFARKALQQYKEAMADLDLVLELEPNNTQACLEMDKINKIVVSKPTKLTFDPKNIFASKPKAAPEKKAVEKEAGKQTVTPAESKSKAKDVEVGQGESAVKHKPVFGSVIPSAWKEVKPIIRPTHLRSKVILKKIQVKDVIESDMPTSFPSKKDLVKCPSGKDKKSPSRISQNQSTETSSPCQSQSDLKSSGNEMKPVQEVTSAANKIKCIQNLTLLKDNTKTLVEDVMLSGNKTKSDQKLTSSESRTNDVPGVPHTCVQLQNAWKQVRYDHKLAYAYLRQLPLDRLAKLFGSSLESELLSELLAALSSPPFLRDESFVYAFLRTLTEVERFKSLVLFMSDADKKVLEQCLQTLECSARFNNQDLTALRVSYDVT